MGNAGAIQCPEGVFQTDLPLIQNMVVCQGQQVDAHSLDACHSIFRRPELRAVLLDGGILIRQRHFQIEAPQICLLQQLQQILAQQCSRIPGSKYFKISLCRPKVCAKQQFHDFHSFSGSCSQLPKVSSH